MPLDGKKMTYDRIQNVEHFFGDLCSEMSSVTKKKARFVFIRIMFSIVILFHCVEMNFFFFLKNIFFRLRDKYDDIGRIVRGYSDVSRFNDTLFNGLLNFSKSCTLLADVKDMEVQRLQSKVNILI